MEEYLQKDFNKEKILSEVQNPDSVFMLAQVKENDSLLPVGYMKVNFGSAQTEKSSEVEWLITDSFKYVHYLLLFQINSYNAFLVWKSAKKI